MQPTNLLPLVMQFLTPDLINKIADALGLDRTLARTIITVAVPALLGAMTGAAAQPGGAQKLVDAAKETGSFDNLSSLIGGGNMTAVADKGSQLLSSLLGGQEKAIATTLSNFAGIGETAGQSVLGIAAPIVVGSLTSALGTSGLNAANVAELAGAQSKHVAAALPPGLRDQLQSALGGTGLSNAFREAPPNLIARVMQLLTPDTTAKIGEAQGLDPAATKALIGASVPALFGILGGVARQSGGAQKLDELAKQSEPIENLTSMLGGTSKPAGLVDKGSQMLGSLLGGQEKALTSAVSKFTGTGQAAGASVLAMLTPLVMVTIKKAAADSGTGAAGFAQLLAAQKDNLAAALPSGLRDQLGAELGGTHLFDALRDRAGQATAAVGEGSRAAAAATTTALRTGAQAAGAAAADTARAAGATATAATTSASSPLKWFGWAIPIIVLAALLWYFFGRPGEQATQTTESAPVNTPSNTASTAPTSPTAGTSTNTQANSSAPSSLPNIPSLTIGGLDVGKQVNDSLGSLRISLQGITDKASASAALPHLQQVTTQLDKIGSTFGQATAVQRKTIAGWLASLLPSLNPLFEKVLGMPDAASVLKPTIEGLRGKLTSLNNQVSGATAQGTSAAHNAAPAQNASTAQSPSPTQNASGYSFSAVKDGNAETLTLSGSLPDQATRQAMLAAAKRMFPTDRIVDNTQIKSGAPPEFGKSANSLLQELSRLGTGNAKLTGTDAEISGSAFSDQAASAIKTALASVPGLHVKTDVATVPVTPVNPTDCQKLFKDLLDRAQIQFETGSSNIEADSTGLLDHLVGVARRCSSATFQVAGYTDSEGNPDINMALSKRRAETVAKYLVTEGINTDRVTSVGYGAADPIASNNTEDGRAKNRRIEITTKEVTATTKK